MRQKCHRGTPWAASAANDVDGARVAGGSPAPLMPAVGKQSVTNAPLARKAQPDRPVAAMSSTHGSLTAEDLRDPEKQTGWSSSWLSRKGEAFAHWARRGKGRKADTYCVGGIGEITATVPVTNDRVRDIRGRSWPRLMMPRKSCNCFSHDDINSGGCCH